MAMLFGIFVTIVGAALIAWGVRGRHFADEAPRCRRCGYDLRATAGERCPECGASLTDRRAIRRGRVWRRPRWIAVGFAVLLVGGATIGLDRGGLLTDRTLDRLTPTAFLLWRAEHERGQALSPIIDRLTTRLALEPGRVTDAQHRRLLARLVALHADAAGPWRPAWCDPIERSFAAGTLSPELLGAYLEPLVDSIDVTLQDRTLSSRELIRPSFDWRTAPRVREGRQARFFGSAAAPFWAVDCRLVMRLGDVVFADQSASRTPDGFIIRRPDDSDWQPNWGYVPRVPRDVLTTLAPGPQTLEIEMIFDLQDTSRRSLGTLHRTTRAFRIPVTLEDVITRPAE